MTFNLFANVTVAQTPWLDQNFAAISQAATNPCTASGTNAITLTLSANLPAVPSYANYQAYSFIASASNTGATTANVGTLGSRNVYKDTSQGPQALVSGDITQNNVYTLIYDSALNSGSGGFHIRSGAGAYLSSPVVKASAVALTTGTVASVAALSLPPGDWDVWFEGAFTGGTNTTISYMELSVNSAALTINTLTGYSSALVGAGAALFNYGADPNLTCGPCQFTVATAQVLTANAKAVFATGTMSVYGLMRARLAR